ncbi:MAG: phosphatidylserine decarboxylase [Streptosporangiaceae bacterium]
MMITARSWQAARRYVLPLLIAAGALVPVWKRAAMVTLGAAGILLAFFRDPGRVCPAEPGTVYAPTDGMVTAVEDDGRTLKVVTFLAVHNVHVARAPVAGPLAAWSWQPGPCLPAFLRRAEENRRAELWIGADGVGRAGLVLAAGILARRVVPWAKPGDALVAGQRLGIICLGSKSILLLPSGQFTALARRGQRVTAGVTPVAAVAGRSDQGVPPSQNSLNAMAS